MNKKETILKVALTLFSNQGFENTTTSAIARQAAVSEGLIFRHFVNKEGLLNAIMLAGIEKIAPFLDAVMAQQQPQRIIATVIELPHRIILAEKEFWKLQIQLKSQNKKFKQAFDSNVYLMPIYDKLIQTFTDLEYENPVLETEYLFTLLNGLTLTLIELENIDGATQLIHYIQAKYMH